MPMKRSSSMSLDQALELADHASPAPETAHQALCTLRDHVLGLRLKNREQSNLRRDAVEAIVRAACETDPAEPGAPDTICIGVADLQHIVEQYILESPPLRMPLPDSVPAEAVATVTISKRPDPLGSRMSFTTLTEAGRTLPAGKHLLYTSPIAEVRGDEKALPIESAPKDGTLLRLLVRFDEHSIEDAEEAWTIGHNSFEANGQDVWSFAGWCWTHDHFTEGKGTPISWLPMLSTTQPVEETP